MKKLVTLAIVISMIGCAEHKENHKVDRKAEGEKLMQVSRDWSKMAQTKDIEKTLDYWADDAVMYSAGHRPLKGKAEIRKMIQETSNIPGFSIKWEPLTADVSESGDMGYLTERSEMTFPDSTGKMITMYNNSVTVWKKQADGQWKNVVDIMTPVGDK